MDGAATAVYILYILCVWEIRYREQVHSSAKKQKNKNENNEKWELFYGIVLMQTRTRSYDRKKITRAIKGENKKTNAMRTIAQN